MDEIMAWLEDQERAATGRYNVVVRNGWSWVIGNPLPRDCGPFRYREDAQDYADELNARPMSKFWPGTKGADA